MSISLMTAAWKVSMPSGRKLVLLSLCDNANDQGECYPSINTIAERCSMGERTVQVHIKELARDGLILCQERTGRSTIYLIDPRKLCTPADSAPPQKTAPTPADSAPPPPQILHPTPADSAPITVIEPSIEPSRTVSGSASKPPKPPPPAFDGLNDEEIPPKAVVPLATEFRLPADWGADALALGWTRQAVLKQSEVYRQYWVSGRGKGTRRSVKGWRQSWSNWLVKAERMGVAA